MNEEGNQADIRAVTVPTYGFSQPGYIYFVTDGDCIKIGISGAPQGRIAALQGSNPRPLKQLAVISGGIELERAFHIMFAHLWIRGEWFRDTTGEISRYLKNVAPQAVKTSVEQRDDARTASSELDLLNAARGKLADKAGTPAFRRTTLAHRLWSEAASHQGYRPYVEKRVRELDAMTDAEIMKLEGAF